MGSGGRDAQRKRLVQALCWLIVGAAGFVILTALRAAMTDGSETPEGIAGFFLSDFGYIAFAIAMVLHRSLLPRQRKA